VRSTILLHGKIDTFSSFSLVNRRLIEGLRHLGHVVDVLPSDRLVRSVPRVGVPDVYIAHDYPFDWVDTPGRFNVFVLAHEYFELPRTERTLVDRLNARFDLLVVPSRFSGLAARRSGIRIPILLCPWGADRREFHPAAPPVRLPRRKRFRFVYVGGAFERKGTDVLVRAYREEFRASDDVALIIKAFSYAWRRSWIEAVLGAGRHPEGPEIVYRYGVARSVAGYYTAADVGVFPYRGEGFGLPILECLAAGTPVIVTRHGAASDFCSRTNAQFIRARRRRSGGLVHMEPDRRHLRTLLRAAYEQGPLEPAHRARVAASVAAFTWARTAWRLSRAIEAGLASMRRPRAVWATGGRPLVVWASQTREGRSMDGTIARHVDRGLRRAVRHYRALDQRHRPWPAPIGTLVAESGSALEHFLAARRLSPDARRILVCGDLPAAAAARLADREKARCGVALRPQLLRRPMRLWRDALERRLAHATVVWSPEAARWLGPREGAGAVHVVAPGVALRSTGVERPRTLRFLFVSGDPFRDGVRLVLEAWDRLRPARAELLCVVPEHEITASTRLIRYLVRYPAIRVISPARRTRAALLESVDCLLLPSLGTGMPVPVLEAMGHGRAVIASTRTAAAHLVARGGGGYVVQAGSVDALTDRLATLLSRPHQCRELGAAALETARLYPWRQFEQRMADLVIATASR
jgi:glycosyltransferase involved in cell wall biosynthesis